MIYIDNEYSRVYARIKCFQGLSGLSNLDLGKTSIQVHGINCGRTYGVTHSGGVLGFFFHLLYKGYVNITYIISLPVY